MFLLRVVLVLLAVVVGASMLAYLLSGDRRYLAMAWKLGRWTLVFVFCVLALLFLERVLAPVAGVL
ncbi:MAG: hypothetical protein WBP72_14770 [Rhodocyclaceae bacterium]